METKRIKLWDLPTRVFHWVLAVLIVAAVITGKTGGAAIIWHGKIGLAILGLVVFRIIWGLIGSTYARFANFFPTPGRLKAYLRGQWTAAGHNPLGALSVFGLLTVIVLQLASGLMANDDIAFQGPLYELIGKNLSDTVTGIHRQLINLLLVLIGLHLAAIAFYAIARKDNLVKPMLSGWKEVKSTTLESARGGGIKAFIAALLIALLAVYGASGAWIPPAKPVFAPSAAPAW